VETSAIPLERATTICASPITGCCCHYNCGVTIDLESRTLESSAPTRIDLAGGTIDIWPLYLLHEGAQSLNVAIDLRARARIQQRDDGRIAIRSLDTGVSLDVEGLPQLENDSRLPLLSRIVRHFHTTGITLTTTAESPAGAGIAGSSALNIAVCGAMAAWAGVQLDPESLLQTAQNVEAQAIQVPTGAQDYRPALFGGIAAIELGVAGVSHVRLDVDPLELQRRMVLAYTGAPRRSGTNNWEIFKRHIDGDRDVFDCFERIRDTAAAMRQALQRGRWDETGRLIAEEWETRKRLAPGVTTPVIEDLISRGFGAGAEAAKVCGAGGGGCLFFWAEPSVLPYVRGAVRDAGARVLEFSIETSGLTIESP
jgi:D-glycero-alpha-D-manno-heptose-7-phosphate kinase